MIDAPIDTCVLVVCVQMIPIASFVRAAADGKAPWPTTQDIWYSERVVDVNDDVTKWCRARCTS